MGRTHDRELRGAARKGHNPRVERMLGEGADVNSIGDFGATAFSEAVYGGHLDVIRTLLNAGADPRLTPSILWWAVQHGDRDGPRPARARC